MVDATVFVVSFLVTVVALIWGLVYLRSRSYSTPPMLRKDLSSVQDVIKDDQGESTTEDANSSSAARKPERWPIEEPLNSHALWPSRKPESDTVQCDPLEFCGHIQREMKRTKHRIAVERIEAEMTEEQKEEERQAQRRQLEEIFKLMQNHKEEFGLSSVDEIQEQMKLYVSA